MTHEQNIKQVVKALGHDNTGNVMEAFGWTPDDFEKGFQLANDMQNLDLVKLLYSNFNQNKIIIEFTLLGKAEYEKLK